jgi:hypothetical protein
MAIEKINCIYFGKGIISDCTNKRVRRSFIIKRCCCELGIQPEKCKFKVSIPKPNINPAPQSKRTTLPKVNSTKVEGIDKTKVINKPPILIREGSIGTCPNCKSTEIKRFIMFGMSIGCINPECKFYYKRNK